MGKLTSKISRVWDAIRARRRITCMLDSKGRVSRQQAPVKCRELGEVFRNPTSKIGKVNLLAGKDLLPMLLQRIGNGTIRGEVFPRRRVNTPKSASIARADTL